MSGYGSIYRDYYGGYNRRRRPRYRHVGAGMSVKNSTVHNQQTEETKKKEGDAGQETKKKEGDAGEETKKKEGDAGEKDASQK